ncbi:bifunctional ADP-dependent NAD(P)H-hydrate dehydratase/NAD(P)H-hydrate epimerase [Arthrobacter ginkgonis]|uniref:ADP-dependent (S)-NAD(P)H-hydrate dehydratase n=1 Tax=Arthrobacter ginkgonis TaxID=1630594 RepID=A0ABP7BZP2_9MICC
MIPAYTGSQVRAAEQPLLDAGRGPALMGQAAFGLAHHTMDLLRTERGRVYGSSAAALVGTGNNGGDALFALALMAKRGVACTAILTGEKAHPGGLAALRKAGGKLVRTDHPVGSRPRSRVNRWREANQVIAGADVLIDAVVGTGARGAVELPRVSPGTLVVACDLPSGVDADTGEAHGGVLPADLTVTFGALKVGLAVGEGRLLAGRVEVVDIGLGPHLGKPELRLLEPKDAVRTLPRPAQSVHKYSRGVLGVVAGSAQYPGAALLTATAAVNTGLGMLRTVSAPEVGPLLAQRVPEAVPAQDTTAHVQAWAVGPGIGEDPLQAKNTAEAIGTGQPCVVDASALRTFQPEQGHGRLVLTPHAGELEDLLNRAGLRVDRTAIERDPLRWARWAAVGYSSVVLLKGPTTVCVSPDGYAIVVSAGGPELATAGSGDVLTGIIGALLAVQPVQLAPHDLVRLAATAAMIHGTAGRLAGPGPFGASGLAEAVPEALALVRQGQPTGSGGSTSPKLTGP